MNMQNSNLTIQSTTVFPEAFPGVDSFALSTVTSNDPKKVKAVKKLLPSPSLDIIVQTLMAPPPYPNEPSATEVERKELWMLHSLKSKLSHKTYKRLETLIRTKDSHAGFLALAGVADFIISGILYGEVALPYVAAGICTSILSLAGSYMCFRSLHRLYMGLHSMEGTVWYGRLPAALIRADVPIMPSILMEIALLLGAEEPKSDVLKWRLLNSLSVSDHLAMMRLTTKLEGTRRFTSGKENVVTLDGDTQETCHRVMEAIDMHPDVCDDMGRIIIKF